MLRLRSEIREPNGVVQSHKRLGPRNRQTNRGHQRKTDEGETVEDEIVNP